LIVSSDYEGFISTSSFQGKMINVTRVNFSPVISLKHNPNTKDIVSLQTNQLTLFSLNLKEISKVFSKVKTNKSFADFSSVEIISNTST